MTARSSVSRIVLRAWPAVLALWAVAGQAADPSELLAAIRDGRARPDLAVRAAGFRFTTGLGVVHLDDGVLVPAEPVAGRPVEWVFLGEGRAHLEPPDGVERGQLELFTGAPVLDERFDRAVFAIALDAAGDALARLPRAAADARVGEASALLEQWRGSPERRLIDVEARLLRDAVDDPLGRSFFCGYFNGRELGRFLWVVDPLAEEQVIVGRFVAAQLTDRERRRAERHLEREQRRGKLIGLAVDDLGVWDTWVSSSLRAPDGTPTPGTAGVEPRRYAIDATLDGKQLDLQAVARVELDVVVDGLRAVTFDIGAELVPLAVRDGDGRPLAFNHSWGELTVLLGEPAAGGSSLTLEVAYRGTPFERVTNGAYAQRDPLGWYPHAGTVDRATYEVVVRWPRRYQLLGSGKVVDHGIDGQGRRWERRTLEVRSLGFSFEVGDFDTATGRVGDVAVTVAIDRLGQGASRGLAAEVLQSVEGPLTYYQEIFGPYPLDELVVASCPRTFSQGLLGFVTLSTTGIVDWDRWASLLGYEDRRLLIAHELGHQWWGNQVGWRSYRDQWVSEAMANYAALLYERNVMTGEGGQRVGLGPTSGWQSELGRLTAGGRPVESLGPVTLGARLNSSLSADAYHAIVYKKGAVVLDMLARLYGEGAFLDILRELVRVVEGRAISTDDFLALLERIGGVELDWFRRQYVLGTGLPEIFYDYRVEDLGGGRWALDGEARQQSTFVFRYRIEQQSGGGLDVTRRAEPRLDVGDSVLVVPFQVALAEAPAAAGGGPGVGVLAGRLVLRGAASPFRLELEQRPAALWLDPNGEVFGRFLAVARWPRRSALQRGLDLAYAGDVEQAEAAFLAAFDEPVVHADEPWLGNEVDVEASGRIADISLDIELARLYLDRGRLAEAGERVARARSRMLRDDRWRFGHELLALEARLAIRSGQPARALVELRKALERDPEAVSAEVAALLAVACRLAGPPDEWPAACRDARGRGVDLGPLECPAE
ncbi:MAG TPA: M1 family aminopeptidase [Thermoanaerobaculales bacterium]|nr:M1 family aminopeptidase [Thermoanaerobaculales bacterium]HPA79806.1 M1 family aminopeptidase [Thermoanaerobaculales bacterium]HQL30917.1 M1 family aminopeptidase [Thermoanaerobaculales bacterium]HQN96999.1 M1 family aminopeptidase [Thermoanaerobaculales bacterium]HQP44317.1 M1 family aminopeptidase [Thermoanaerobaculales bacterium]